MLCVADLDLAFFFLSFLKAKDFFFYYYYYTGENSLISNILHQQFFFSEAGIGTNRYSASIFFTELSNRFKLPHFLPFYGELHCCKHFLRKSSFFYNTVIKVKVQVNSTSPICSKFYHWKIWQINIHYTHNCTVSFKSFNKNGKLKRVSGNY